MHKLLRLAYQKGWALSAAEIGHSGLHSRTQRSSFPIGSMWKTRTRGQESPRLHRGRNSRRHCQRDSMCSRTVHNMLHCWRTYKDTRRQYRRWKPRSRELDSLPYWEKQQSLSPQVRVSEQVNDRCLLGVFLRNVAIAIVDQNFIQSVLQDFDAVFIGRIEDQILGWLLEINSSGFFTESFECKSSIANARENSRHAYSH